MHKRKIHLISEGSSKKSKNPEEMKAVDKGIIKGEPRLSENDSDECESDLDESSSDLDEAKDDLVKYESDLVEYNPDLVKNEQDFVEYDPDLVKKEHDFVECDPALVKCELEPDTDLVCNNYDLESSFGTSTSSFGTFEPISITDKVDEIKSETEDDIKEESLNDPLSEV